MAAPTFNKSLDWDPAYGFAKLARGKVSCILIGQSYRHGMLRQGDTGPRFPPRRTWNCMTRRRSSVPGRSGTPIINPGWKNCTDYLTTLAEAKKEIESGGSSSTSFPCHLKPTSSNAGD